MARKKKEEVTKEVSEKVTEKPAKQEKPAEEPVTKEKDPEKEVKDVKEEPPAKEEEDVKPQPVAEEEPPKRAISISGGVKQYTKPDPRSVYCMGFIKEGNYIVEEEVTTLNGTFLKLGNGLYVLAAAGNIAYIR